MTTLSRYALGLIAIACAASCAHLSPAEQAPPPVRVTATPVALDESDPSRTTVGGLRYLGGVVLRSADARFAGLSSLRWDAGRLYAASDQGGAWFALTPVERDDRLVDVAAVTVGQLVDEHGRPLTGKEESDAESMTLTAGACGDQRCPARAVSIGFERDDRILIYRLANGMPVGRPVRRRGMEAWLARQPDNLGVEAMAGDTRMSLLVSEGLRTAGGEASALVVRPGMSLDGRRATPVEIAVPAPGEARPSDLDQIDATRFVMLRRSWNEADGFRVDVELLTLRKAGAGWQATTRPLAHFAPPLVTDNYEGVAVRHSGARTFVYLVSDDNADPHQRTLLLKFELVG